LSAANPIEEALPLHLTAVIMFIVQIGMILAALPSKDFSLTWKAKAVVLLPVLPFIAFFDVYVKYSRGEFP